MRPSSMIFVLLLSSATLTAQTSTGNNPAVLVKPPIAQSCPVGFSVDRVPQGAVVRTKEEQAPRGQGLNLTFAKPTAQIVSADIIVHGYPARARVIPATPPVPSEVTESFHLTASTDQPLLHSTIWTNRMILANWVELKHLEYADGTTWQSSAPRQCAASPSLFVLVDSVR